MELDDSDFSMNKEDVMNAAKPIFYGFSFLAGVTMTVSPAYAGTLLGIAMIGAITFVGASLSDSLGSDWKKFMDIVLVLILLTSVLAGSYVAAVLSFLG